MTEQIPFPSFSVPEDFLWGAATAAHQVEGNNVSSDWWALEHSNSPVIAEPSGDAADHFNRWPEDLDILASLGLNSYRFSLEWSRIEPERGAVSMAAIDHYKRMVAGCVERGLTPVVTLQHVTLPAWFRRAGGWQADGAAELFASYAETVLPVLNEGAEWVATINEPGLQPLMSALHRGDQAALNAWHGGPMPLASDTEIESLITAHRAARDVVRAGTDAHAGWTVVLHDVQHEEEGRAAAEEWFETFEAPYLRAARDDDFVGVQNYTRSRFNSAGEVLPGPEDRMTAIWEYYPEALGNAVRLAKSVVGDVPIVVTENGVPTDDDTERVEFINRALRSLDAAIADGVDVRGYLHWSAIDNFEWALGYGPRFGLIGFDHTTFARSIKPSARWYGELARRHSLALTP
ncbi:family 1 glycosylhydrolase [Frigoribacterium sp. Leaf172]|uniref:family 1 glycosylhydrolase n=1 Tax=Frigoribacterium sp. Leaf172 TaxID=1736285 RepID=UPI0006F5E8B6|nr:family 1 glycosylhydrolase [Frigoribacterium sp. Leaf172]KQR66020.1 beta-glucosidase [Frigoribacterium sp. Leaf172]